jgi:tRNA(fMet)-specific endonuclease VapC
MPGEQSGNAPLLLDSTVCVDVLRRRPGAARRLAERSPVGIHIATMTEAELWYGALHARNPLDRVRVEDLLAALTILPFDRAAARAHAAARLALRHQPIGDRDLVIASVALAHGLTVATGNVREFARVPGLAVEDWGAA